MVTVYKSYFERGYDWAMPVGSPGQILELKARGCGDPWKPIWMYMLTTDAQGNPRQPADMPWHGSGTMVLKDRARRVLEPVLGEDAEWLPGYDSNGEDLWLVHAWRVVDALDEEHSDVERFKSSGRIMRVRRYVLHDEAVKGVRCFRLPQQLSRILVTDEVASAVSAAGLHGTRFVPIWRTLLRESALLPLVGEVPWMPESRRSSGHCRTAMRPRVGWPNGRAANRDQPT